ncbi:mlp [Lactobacillus hamsteri DSM 5661 = JCM 6256]|uniref:Mlp n=1 Tax=Lactobacillus hamsteri DSM 5661 = JCM 6256 TaxID=1423754 RepID=A0A0R1YE51_9LACO|nr:YSIRK signal domain/LPXTG anchor domain surface protein [Lactobacillus hamsteri]KRM37814.1 mlp [Lactobacillus hamsteri DSM 5661 = JCM 6256]
MKKHNDVLLYAEANQRQRFSIRKLSIGTASVLLGTCFFLAGQNNNVEADTLPTTPNSSAVEVDHQNDERTKSAIDNVQKDIGDEGTVDEDGATTIDRTIHYQEKDTGKTLSGDVEEDISIVPYYKNGHLNITYHDDTDNKDIEGSDNITQYVGTKIKDNEVNNKINSKKSDLTKQGYDFSSTDNSGLDNSHKFTEKDQHIVVHFKHGISSVDETRTGTQIVHYEGAGDQTPNDTSETVTFNRTNTTDNVTKEVTFGKWDSDGKTYTEVPTPIINGYIADITKVGGDTVTATDKDIDRKYIVKYTPIGKIIPVDKNGNPIPDPSNPNNNVPNTPYINDPSDPTKVKPDEKTPEISGWHRQDPSQTTITPNDPTKDTHVVYIKEANGKIVYIDDDANNKQLSSDKFNGDVGDKINYSTADKIVAYENQGYKLVSNNFKDGNETYKESGNSFEVHFVHNLIPVTTKTPHGVDPSMVQKDVKETVKYEGAGDKTPKDVVQTSQWTRQLTMDQVTGQIIPNGKLDKDWAIASGQKTNYDEVKTPEVEGYHPNQAAVVSTPVTQEDITKIVTYSPNGQEVKDQKDVPATQTTKFVDDNGKEIAEKVVQNSNFHYSGDTYDKVTGKQTATGSWDAESHKFNSVNAPVIKGYVADAKTAEGLTATIENPNVENKIVYHRIGKIIPVDPNHKPIPDAPTPDYENDPSDPTKVTPNEPIPEIDGYIPVDPTPITPQNPTKDTQVVYVKKASGKIVYIDDTDNKDLKTETFSGIVGNNIDNTTTDKIKNYENKGYELVSNNFQDGKEILTDGKNYFEIHLKHQFIPINPQNPGKPGQPINPNDPEGPKFPADSNKVIKNITRTIHYEGADNNTPSDITQTVHFEANGVLDKVTGQWITPLTWSGDQTVEGVNTPIVEGYYVTNVNKDSEDKTNVDSKTIAHDGSDYTVTVHYAPYQKAQVIYIDRDMNNLELEKSDLLYGKPDEDIDYTTSSVIAGYEVRGFHVIKDEFPKDNPKFDDDNNTTQIYKVILGHGTTTISPQNPTEKPIIYPMFFASFIQMPSTIDEDDQPTVYYALVDNKQNKIIAKGLTEDEAKRKFAEVESPNIPGYRLVDLTQEQIDNLWVNRHSNKHTDITVLYEKISSPTGNNDNGGNPEPSPDPQKPDTDKPDNPTPPTPSDDGDKKTPEDKPQTPSPEKHKDKKTPKKEHSKKPTTHTHKDKSSKTAPIAHEKKSHDNKRWSQTAATHAQNLDASSKKKHVTTSNMSPLSENYTRAKKYSIGTNADKRQALPQTGEKANEFGLIGLGLASLAALISLAGDKKRKN